MLKRAGLPVKAPAMAEAEAPLSAAPNHRVLINLPAKKNFY